MVRAGRLRHRVTLQSATTSQDAYGAPVETWSDQATVWAAVEPLSGREFFTVQAERAELSHRIRIRHRADVTPSWRVSYDSRTFDIETVVNVMERDRELHLMCREVVS